ncbi:TolC family protein [Candidatus Methylacidiphilum infernorum]|uniref:TolC family protein n=1 Tax=Candidatus Methylacidiphilum infernorum TaxID=511746 RepID=A0ABX7PV05_9BACT|nr:TolC family protein [Candidatus Methylacidiphilum infernorum]QSR86439.1 TolC family protein [Candidatus Methylacidiphilum infernorum]
MKRWLFFQLLFWLFLGWGLHRTEGAQNKQGLLKNLLDRGLSADPSVRYFLMEIEAAKGQQIQARLFPFPQFIGYIGPWSSGGAASTPSAFSPYGYQFYELYQPLPFPGKLKSRKEIAALDQEIAELIYKRYKLFLAFKIYSLAYSIGLTGENLRVTQEIIERISALIDFLSRRPKIGIQALIEMRILEGGLIGFLQNKRELEQNLVSLKSQLNAFLNFSPSNPLPLDILPDRPLPKLNFEELKLLSLEHNPTLLINERLIRRAEKELALTKLNAYPDFTVGPFWEYNKGINTDQGGGVTFTVGIPFSGSNIPGQAGFAWTTNKGNIISAQAKLDQSRSLYKATVQLIYGLLGSRFAVYEKAREQLLDLPTENILGQLSKAAAMAERQYRLGAIDVNRFLAVQRQYLAVTFATRGAQMDAISSFYELQNIAGIDPSQTAL